MTESRFEVRRLAVAGAVVVALVLLSAASLLRFAARSVDNLQLEEERRLIARTVYLHTMRLASDVTTATVWDQAYDKLRPGVEVAWADAEIGSYFANNRNHDRTFVYDAQDHPFYAWSGEHRIAPLGMAAFQRDVRPMLVALRRAEVLEPRPHPPRAQTDPDLAVLVHGLIRSEGVYYMVVASTVAPEVWNAPRRPGPAVVVISAQRLDRTLTPFFVNQLRIVKPRFVSAGASGPATMTLRNPAGAPIGAVVWEPKRPGLEALRKALPFIVAGFVALVLAAALLAVRVQAVVQRLNAKEERLSRAVSDLMVARDAAQNASRAKSEFLANMSHEIRTPLNGVLGMAQVMARHRLDVEQSKRLQVIHNQGELLLNILNAVLDLSKIESGKLELDIHPFDLGETIRTACDVFANQARLKDLSFDLAIDTGTEGLWMGDDVRLRQVLTNLVSNAVKFTSQGGISVTVRGGADGLQFSVRDTGIGIPRDKIAHLFEKFTQADTSTTRRFGGTGLGLAISRELVELMGGRMEASSVPGEGSEFGFSLPLERCAAAVSVETARPETAAADRGETLRVLAAEDNTTNQLILRALLEPLDIQLTVVENGVLALEAVRAQRFDVILMDAQMPELNGPEAASAIRRFEAEAGRPRTPIVALTANVMSHQLAVYREAGMDGFVAKPIDAARLFEAIAQATRPPEAAASCRAV